MQFDTKYILIALIIVVVVGAVYMNTKVTALEESVQKHEKFNMHIGDAFKPLHQKYSEHETRLSNIDDSLKIIRNRIVKSSESAPTKKRVEHDDDDEEDELVSKLRK